MRILFLKWNSYGNEFILDAFHKKGIEVVIEEFPRKQINTKNDSDYTKKIVGIIFEQKIDYVFTFNYFPVIAIACQACKKIYLSWIYDSPFVQVYSKTVFYDTNRVFLFDKGTCEELWKRGVTTVFYLPMAANPNYYAEIIRRQTAEEQERFSSDISFVGSMYLDSNQKRYQYLEKLDSYTRGYLDALILAQKNIYGAHILEEGLNDTIMESIQKVCPVYGTEDGFESAKWTFANYFLARKITSSERSEVIGRLEELSHQKDLKIKLYSGDELQQWKGVHQPGVVDYYEEAPLVFNNTKINLNISLKSILTGIPLRAFDIMGCQGFLLSNYQQDFIELFEPGEEFVYYESVDDLIRKCDYYLEHECQRKMIAEAAYEKICREHTYELRVAQMLDICAMK